MTDGYLSKDRDRLNRMQRERRASIVRIDYQPDDDALHWIEAKRGRYGPESTNSATLNAILREWAELTGINKRKVDAPTTSAAAGVSARIAHARETSGEPSGISEVFEVTRASKSGPKLRQWQRLPCGAKRRRDGKPCEALSVPGKQRCKWHGGCSTGPTTPEGKARALANLRRGKA